MDSERYGLAYLDDGIELPMPTEEKDVQVFPGQYSGVKPSSSLPEFRPHSYNVKRKSEHTQVVLELERTAWGS
jgi:hypothetical protein